jgi:hypothetical protein
MYLAECQSFGRRNAAGKALSRVVHDSDSARFNDSVIIGTLERGVGLGRLDVTQAGPLVERTNFLQVRAGDSDTRRGVPRDTVLLSMLQSHSSFHVPSHRLTMSTSTSNFKTAQAALVALDGKCANTSWLALI